MAEYEYSRFGNGFVRRTKDTTDDWMSCPQDDVPAEFFAEETKTAARRMGMRDVPEELPADGELIGAKVGSQTQMVAVRHANPSVDAMAAELGLTGNELRARLNGAPGGTNKRVDDERFDFIAAALGVHPADARDLFADRA